jgi:hypothetical protein
LKSMAGYLASTCAIVSPRPTSYEGDVSVRQKDHCCSILQRFVKNYSLRPIILFANIDVSRHLLVIDTSVLAKSNMDRREYKEWLV